MERRNVEPTSAVMAITKQKSEAMRLARDQEAIVEEMCRRNKSTSPPYSFEELIGKGAFGRVYKGRHIPSNKIVAIKVSEVDDQDYQALRDFKDESIKDFVHEVRVLCQAKAANAKNVNMIFEALDANSQLWLVCEYCPGGSVKTLMRASGDRLDEKFIVPIAREIAEGLRAIHEAGIIHRDVKAANVLIHEEGRLQICDFGVAGELSSNAAKRSTWIGTPHWMPPEMFSAMRPGASPSYGSEIDVWAYGCTLFECATGCPPNANLRERIQIGRQLNRNPPKLEGSAYSESLRDLVACALDTNPETRPSMAQILQHPYVANSTEAYPTSSLSELVRNFYQWSQRGGQRISLFNPGGAQATRFPSLKDDLDGEWNFSTTDNFEQRFSIIDMDQLAVMLSSIKEDPDDSPEHALVSRDPFEAEQQLSSNAELSAPVSPLSPDDQENLMERAERGAEALASLFDTSRRAYSYETKNDFVPVQQRPREIDFAQQSNVDRSSVVSTFMNLNLGAFDSAHYAQGVVPDPQPPITLMTGDTIKANRSVGRMRESILIDNQDADFRDTPWEDEQAQAEDDAQYEDYQPSTKGPRPPTMTWTFPSMVPEEEQPEREEEEDVVVVDEDDRLMHDNDNNNDGSVLDFDPDDDCVAIMQDDSEETDTVTKREEAQPSDPMAWTFPAVAEQQQQQQYQMNQLSQAPPQTPPQPPPPPPPSHPLQHHQHHTTTRSRPTAIAYKGPLLPTHDDTLDGRRGSISRSHRGHRDKQQSTSSTSSSAQRSRRRRFPPVIPPSTESLEADASEDTMAAEIDRLLSEMSEALAFTRDSIMSASEGGREY